MHDSNNRIFSITVRFSNQDRNYSPDVMAYERKTALKEIESESFFKPRNDENGPYHLTLYIHDGRLVLDIQNNHDAFLPSLILSLKPYRRVIKDYFMMISSYEDARSLGNRAKLEAIDMGRRGLHDEAADFLMSRLKDKIEIDHATARRLFTLICVLHNDTVRLWR